jgi:hypothetical protein
MQLSKPYSAGRSPVAHQAAQWACSYLPPPCPVSDTLCTVPDLATCFSHQDTLADPVEPAERSHLVAGEHHSLAAVAAVVAATDAGFVVLEEHKLRIVVEREGVDLLHQQSIGLLGSRLMHCMVRSRCVVLLACCRLMLLVLEDWHRCFLGGDLFVVGVVDTVVVVVRWFALVGDAVPMVSLR